MVGLWFLTGLIVAAIDPAAGGLTKSCSHGAVAKKGACGQAMADMLGLVCRSQGFAGPSNGKRSVGR